MIQIPCPHITHSNIVTFADDRVNLKRDYASEFRAQARRVKEHVEGYISENPEVGLVKILLSGSLAKSTALKSFRDIDMALYVRASDSPTELPALLEWVAQQFRKTYPNTAVTIDSPCVVISFSGTDKDVEIMPVLYAGDSDWYGTIFDRFSLRKTTTSIPRHLTFIETRRKKHVTDFAQVIRLLKYWAKEHDLKFRSFLIELIAAHMSDCGADFSHYPTALVHFFNLILEKDLQERIFSQDFFKETDLPERGFAPIEVYDPVSPTNNVAADYSENDRQAIVSAAEDAVDALSFASSASTKGVALDCWRKVFGSTFNA